VGKNTKQGPQERVQGNLWWSLKRPTQLPPITPGVFRIIQKKDHEKEEEVAALRALTNRGLCKWESDAQRIWLFKAQEGERAKQPKVPNPRRRICHGERNRLSTVKPTLAKRIAVITPFENEGGGIGKGTDYKGAKS